MTSMKTTERNTGIELLRIVAMMMIVCCHITGHYWGYGGKLEVSGIFGLNKFLSHFVNGGVDIFAMISGFGMCYSKLKYSRLIELWLQCLFYSIVISLMGKFFLHIPFAFSGLFPVSVVTWWYITGYFCIILFIPFVNTAVAYLPRKIFYALALLIFCFLAIRPLCFWKSYFFCLNGGFSALWLFCCYIFGCSIRIFCDNCGNKKALLQFSIVVYCCFLLVAAAYSIVGCRIGLLQKRPDLVNRIFSYSSPVIVLCAGSLLILFSQLKIESAALKKWILFFSPLTLGVYLIHDHDIMRSWIMGWKIFPQNPALLQYLLNSFIALVSIYLVCSILDYLRVCLFRLCHIREFSIWIEARSKALLNKLLGKIA